MRNRMETYPQTKDIGDISLKDVDPLGVSCEGEQVGRLVFVTSECEYDILRVRSLG